MQSNTYSKSTNFLFSDAFQQFGKLVKFKLSMLVVTSAILAYLIALPSFTTALFIQLPILFLGGFLVTAASNIINEVLEKDYDKLMKRTADRPLVTGRISVSNAVLLAGSFCFFGILFLCLFNALAGLLGAVSFVMYAFLYTPMKRLSPWAVVIGAFPGAMPVLIGCVAATGEFNSIALTLFSIQFFWQFPHFWAIAFVGDEDYKNAGFNLLPSKNGELNNSIGLNSLITCLAILPVIYFYTNTNNSSLIANLLVVVLTIIYAIFSYNLYQKNDRQSALNLMFSSFFYLPLVLFTYVIDKIIF